MASDLVKKGLIVWVDMLLNLNPEPTWTSCEDVFHVTCVSASFTVGVFPPLSSSPNASELSSPVGVGDRDRDGDREERLLLTEGDGLSSGGGGGMSSGEIPGGNWP